MRNRGHLHFANAITCGSTYRAIRLFPNKTGRRVELNTLIRAYENMYATGGGEVSILDVRLNSQKYGYTSKRYPLKDNVWRAIRDGLGGVDISPISMMREGIDKLPGRLPTAGFHANPRQLLGYFSRDLGGFSQSLEISCLPNGAMATKNPPAWHVYAVRMLKDCRTSSGPKGGYSGTSTITDWPQSIMPSFTQAGDKFHRRGEH